MKKFAVELEYDNGAGRYDGDNGKPDLIEKNR